MSKYRKITTLLFAIGIMIGLTACTTIQVDPGENGWSLSELETAAAGNDPIEPFNRTMFVITDFSMNYIIDPLGRIYTTILPRPVIEKFDNLCVNLEYPDRLFSSLLMAEWRGAGDETLRFLINTTLGIAGLFDVAEAWFDIYSTEADFGQVFARWGIDPGCTFILPFMARHNIRDAFGFIFDVALDMKTYIPYSGWATIMNRAVVAKRNYDRINEDAFDPYKNFRQMFTINRRLLEKMYFYRAKNHFRDVVTKQKAGVVCSPEIESSFPRPDWVTGKWVDLPGFGWSASGSDSMRSVFFHGLEDDYWFMNLSLFNRDFVGYGKKRTVIIDPENEKKIEYRLFAHKVDDQETPLRRHVVVLLPGIGANWKSNNALVLAEKFYYAGMDVVVLDSIFSWTFQQNRPDGKLPGYLDQDAALLHTALKEIVKDLRTAENGENTIFSLAGYSFGAFHSLKIAQLDQGDERIFSNIVAINPPVDLHYASKTCDEFVAATSAWSQEEALEKIDTVGGALMMNYNRRYSSPSWLENWAAPIAEREAEYVAAISFKRSLRDLIISVHRERPLENINSQWSWFSRNDLYREVDDFSVTDYVEKLLAKDYPDLPVEELFGASSLYRLEETLRSDTRIHVIHNFNDFLLDDQAKRFLDRTLGERICWFPDGGHLGNLYRDEVMAEIIRLFR